MDKNKTKTPQAEDGLLSQDGGSRETPEDGQDVDLQDLDIGCGIGKWKPEKMQKCADIRAFTAALSFGLLSNISGLTYYVGTVRTIEKRFGLSSTEANVTMTITDIFATFLGLLYGYLGRTLHKPRMISVGMVLFSLGILFYAVPFFIYGTLEGAYKKQQSTVNMLNNSTLYNRYERDMCNDASSTTGECHEDNLMVSLVSQKTGALICMILAGALIGLGMPTVGPLGLPYIDENAKPGNSALYIGLTTSMFSWSPIVGFMLAALCTRLPENLIGSSDLNPNSPQWIGAWWFGFVILGLCDFLSAIPLFFFPKHLKHYYLDNKKKKKKTKTSVEAAKIKKYITEFPKLSWKLISNLQFMTLVFSKICGMYVVTGIFMQLPRYMEIHFKQPAYVSNIISALSGALIGAFGNILGGVLMKKFKIGTVGSARMYVFALTVGVATLLVALFLSCPKLPLAGELGQNNKLNVNMKCNTDCGCSLDKFEPVCVNSSVNFISACHAGCQNYQKNNLTFTDCHCTAVEASVTAGLCETETCKMLIPYVLTFLIGSFLSSIGRVPATMLLFRIVGKQDKSFAFGMFSCIVNLLCFIPSPILFGRLFDSTCILWQRKCGERGACLLYDTDKFRYYMHGVTLLFKVASLLFGIVCMILVTRQEKMEKQKQDEEKVKKDVGNSDL